MNDDITAALVNRPSQDRGGVHGGRRVGAGGRHQLVHPRPHVRLLLRGRPRTGVQEVPGLEALPH